MQIFSGGSFESVGRVSRIISSELVYLNFFEGTARGNVGAYGPVM
jgi:hypothetical protein